MRARTLGAVVIAGVTTAAIVRRRSDNRSGAGRPRAPRSGWLGVTVHTEPDQVLPSGRVPGPLAQLGDAVEIDVRPAPGDKGSELRARFRRGGGGEDGRGRLRAALREAKQLIEVGEVLRVDPTPHGRRSATPTGFLVDLATARSNTGGTL